MKNKARPRQKSLLPAALLILVIAVMIWFILPRPVDATELPATVKYYDHVVVEQGDTLWGLSADYREAGYTDRAAYINEVREINHIKADIIYPGDILVVPYYDIIQ